MKSILPWLLSGLITLVLAAVTAEFFVRFVMPRTGQQPLKARDDTDWSRVLRFSPGRIWENRPQPEPTIIMSGVEHVTVYTLTTYPDGTRLSPPDQFGGRLVLCAGDSTVWGYGVNDEDTWPAQLAQYFERHGLALRVRNMGVVGYSVYQTLELLRDAIPRHKPAHVLVTVGINDVSLSAQNDKAWLEARSWSAFVTGMRWYVFPDALRQPGMPERRTTEDDFQVALEEIAALCRQHDAGLHFIVWPQINVYANPSQHVSYGEITRVMAAQLGAGLIDVFEEARAWPAPLMVDNVHVTRSGNAYAAKFIAHALASDGVLSLGPARPIVPGTFDPCAANAHDVLAQSAAAAPTGDDMLRLAALCRAAGEIALQDAALTYAAALPGDGSLALSELVALSSMHDTPHGRYYRWSAMAKTAPGEPAVLAALSRAAGDLGKGEQALDAAQQHMALLPEAPWSYTLKGRSLLVLGRFPEAIQVLEQGLALARQQKASGSELEALLAQARQAQRNIP